MLISCNSLWVKWKSVEPNSLLVKEAEEKIKSYSKKDWDIMVTEANDLISLLINKYKENKDIKHQSNRDAFIEIFNHMKKWFFTPDIGYALAYRSLILTDDVYKNFFDQFEDGLSNYVVSLIDEYYKII